MKYLITQDTTVMLATEDERDSINLATNLSKTTGKPCNIFQMVYFISPDEFGVSINDLAHKNYRTMIQRVKEIMDVTDADLSDNQMSRKFKYRFTRQFIAFILVSIGKYTMERAGEAIGRDHATVINAMNRIKEAFKYDKEFRRKFADVISLCLLNNPKCFE